MPRKTNKRCKVIRVEVDRYTAQFYLTHPKRQFWSIGNAGVGLDIAYMLRKLGHVVEVIEHDRDNE